MGVKFSRSMDAKSPAREAPDKTTGGILPSKGRLIDLPAARAVAAEDGEANRRRLIDDGSKYD